MAKRKGIADYENEWAVKDATREKMFVTPRAVSREDVEKVLDPRSEIYSTTPVVNPGRQDYIDAALATGRQLLNVKQNARDLGEYLGKKAGEYAVRTTPAQFGEDLKHGHAAMFKAAPRLLESAIRHPLEALTDLSPVGSVRDAKDTFDTVAQLYALGDRSGAELAAKAAGPISLMALADVAPLAGLAAKGLRGAVKPALKAATYETAQDGVFRNVARRGVENEIVRMPEAAGASMPELRTLAQDRTRSPAIRLADRHALEARGQAYDTTATTPQTSIKRQAAMGRAHREAASGNPAYEHAVFEQYGNMFPEIVEKSGAQNYGQLTEAAYRQLGEESDRQFDSLPLRLRYHDGPGEYPSSTAMARDVLGNGQLNVFSGGDRHDFLNAVDPRNGLNQNEKFRAVRDYFGHVVPGSQFGPQGEEIAYQAHSQMLSPLARMALLSETRGQNSAVNYGAANADIIAQKKFLQQQARERAFGEEYLRNGGHFSDDVRRALEGLPSLEDILRQQRDLGGQFEYASQKAVLLPPEFLDAMSPGGMPDYLRPLLAAGKDPLSARGVHFSRSGDLTSTDPSFFGQGHQGEEYRPTRQAGLPDRTYFYSGEPGTVSAELPVRRGVKGVYEAPLQNLYDINSDPEGIVRIAKAHNLTGYKPALDYLVAGTRFEPGSAIPDMERMVKDFGYSGYITDNGGQRAAAVYDPVAELRKLGIDPDARYASGGLVEKTSGMPC